MGHLERFSPPSPTCVALGAGGVPLLTQPLLAENATEIFVERRARAPLHDLRARPGNPIRHRGTEKTTVELKLKGCVKLS